MFYVYLISKILLFYLLPYFAITRKASKTLINVKSILLEGDKVLVKGVTPTPIESPTTNSSSTCKSFSIPTPPATFKAPVVVLVALVVFDIVCSSYCVALFN